MLACCDWHMQLKTTHFNGWPGTGLRDFYFSLWHTGTGHGKDKMAIPSVISRRNHHPGYAGCRMLVRMPASNASSDQYSIFHSDDLRVLMINGDHQINKASLPSQEALFTTGHELTIYLQHHARHCSTTICSVLHAALHTAHIAMILNLYPESLPTLVNWLEEE